MTTAPLMSKEQADRELSALTGALDAWRRSCHQRYCWRNPQAVGGTFFFMLQCKAHLQLCVEMREYFRNGVVISPEAACMEVLEVLGSLTHR